MTKAQKDYIEWKLNDYASQAEFYGKEADLTAQIASERYSKLLSGWAECLNVLGIDVRKDDDGKITVKA